MATYGLSLNGLIDGTVQTVVIRFNYADDQLPPFFNYYRSRYTPRGSTDPPLTEAEIFKEWAREVIRTMHAPIRQTMEQKTAQDAVAGMAPVEPPREG
jgi:hypothetical protein